MKNNIQKLRKAHGMTMAKLADVIGTSQQQIDRLEKGKRKLSAEWIDVLCKALQCKPGELVDFSVEDVVRSVANPTASAEIIGAIETKFGNNIRSLEADEKYEIRFKPAAKDAGKRFFALVVEGGNYLSYPEGTELILATELEGHPQAGIQEHAETFASDLKTGAVVHKFVVGGKIVHASIIKSIRAE